MSRASAPRSQADPDAADRGRRLLKLVDLKRTLLAESSSLAVASGFLDHYAMLSALDKPDLAAVAGEPVFGVWLDTAVGMVGRDIHRTLPSGHIAAHLGRLARFAAVAAVRTGATASLNYPLGSDTVVAFPGLGSAVILPPSTAGMTARIEVSANGFRVHLDQATEGTPVSLPRCGSAVVDVADADRTPGEVVAARWTYGDIDTTALGAAAATAGNLLADCAHRLDIIRTVVPVRPGTADVLPVPVRGLVYVEWPCTASEFGSAIVRSLDAQAVRDAAVCTVHFAGEPMGDDEVLTDAERTIVEMCGIRFDSRANDAGAGVVRRDSLQRSLGRMSVTDRSRFDSVAKHVAALPPSAFQRRAVAHISYTRRDFATAADAYGLCLQDAPGDIDLWTDLAFALRHLGRRTTADRILAAPERLAAAAADSGMSLSTEQFGYATFLDRLPW
ncbi:MAG: hypothetical protein JST91_31255 [Actinobacteria bacterium]|nr:hypothetical protein [Actinomycetota bacterium]